MSTGTVPGVALSEKLELPLGLVGSNWACSYSTPDGFISAGNVAFSGGGNGTAAGGIYICDMDINNQRPLPGFPEGAHVTVLTGSWKKVDACHFDVVASAVVLSLQADPTDPTIRTWQPLARIKDVATMKLHGNKLRGTRTVSFYDYFDISLTKKLPPPFADLVQTVQAQRVTQ